MRILSASWRAAASGHGIRSHGGGVLRRGILAVLIAIVVMLGSSGHPANASASAPTVTVTNHQVSSATGATVSFTTDPGAFLYLGQVIIRMQLTGFTASLASGATACGWITTSPSRTTGGCNYYNSGGSTYLDFSVANGGAAIGSVTYTITIPSAYLTTPSTPGNYNAYGAHETNGGTFVNSAATAVGIDNVLLSAMSVTTATLTPTFSSATTTYSSSVSNGTSSVTVTPTAANAANAVIRVNGSIVTSGSASSAVVLAVGANTITVAVTGNYSAMVQSYTITITRAGSAVSSLSALVCGTCTLSPSFSSGTTSYSATVSSDVSSVTMTPTTTDSNASVTVNGTSVASGTASQPLSLSSGVTTITIVVTAQDSTTTTYLVQVTRSAALSSESPAPWLLAYGRISADERCLPGWNPSWASWVFGGLGGFTCERRMEWSDSLTAWVSLPGFS